MGVGLGVAAAGGANSPGTTVALPEVADGAMVPRCAAAPRGSVPNVNRPVFGFSQPGFHELVAASASATPNSSAVWYRSSGLRASAFITTAASGAGNVGRDLVDRDRVVVRVALQRLDRPALGRIRQLAGQELVEQHARGEHVGCGAQRLTECLLRRHVRRCADHLALLVREGLVATDDRGDAEVGDLQRTRGREHEVLGLDVAVEDPSRMCGLQRSSRSP